MKNNWEEVQLNDVIEFDPRESVSKGQLAKKVTMADIKEWDKKISNFELSEYKGGSKFRNGDTLLARITPCLENGKTAFVDILNIDEIGFGSTEYIVMRNVKGVTDSHYIYYLARSPEFRTIAIQAMVGSSGRQRVQRDVLENTRLNLPPLPEQKAIAHILGSLDDKIELNRQMNKTLEEIAQAMFKSWFVDFDPVFDNAIKNGKDVPEELQEKLENRKNVKDKKPLPKDIQDLFPDEFEMTEEMGWVPKGWKVGKLRDIIEKVIDNRGMTPPNNDQSGIPLVEVNAIRGEQRFFEYSSIKKYVDEETYDSWFRGHPKLHDVLITTVGSIGEIALSDHRKFCIAQNIIAIRSTVGGIYLYEFLKHNQERMVNLDISSVQPSIKVPHLKNMSILLADEERIYQGFTDQVKAFSDQIEKNNEEMKTLASLRDTLLPKLVSGEVRLEDETIEKLNHTIT